MKTILFQMISDNRFTDNIENEIDNLKRQTETALKGMDVVLRSGEKRFLDFEDGVKQYRVDFYVTKSSNKITYNDIYTAVNRVKPVPYKFV